MPDGTLEEAIKRLRKSAYHIAQLDERLVVDIDVGVRHGDGVFVHVLRRRGHDEGGGGEEGGIR